MLSDNPGIEFERIVAEIQSQVDPSARVVHNEKITDRLGQKRQFDVVIRGEFAGYDVLGVFECKDLKRKVGVAEIDAFVSKSADINANFKVVVSKSGFSKGALKKAEHYGVQTFSLVSDKKANNKFRVGTYWYADVYFWDKISITLDFLCDYQEPLIFDAKELRIEGFRVVDWFTNYLLDNHINEEKTGWVVGVRAVFDDPQLVEYKNGKFVKCKGFVFRALRAVSKKKKFVGLNGDGFFDWQKGKAKFPPGKTVSTDAVESNFMDWDERESGESAPLDIISVRLIAHNDQFPYVKNAIQLDEL